MSCTDPDGALTLLDYIGTWCVLYSVAANVTIAGTLGFFSI